MAPIGEVGEASDNSLSAASDGPPRRGWRSGVKLGAIITAAAAIIAAVGGIVALLFQIDPGLAPCLGGREAHFTGAPVFPQYPYRNYLSDIGHPTSGYPNVKGVEVRVSYQAGNLRGQRLVLRATLVRIGPGGELTDTYTSPTAAADIKFDPSARNFTPNKCSQVGGGAFWLIPPSTGGRWEFILELFAGTNRADRVTLGHTPVFRG